MVSRALHRTEHHRPTLQPSTKKTGAGSCAGARVYGPKPSHPVSFNNQEGAGANCDDGDCGGLALRPPEERGEEWSARMHQQPLWVRMVSSGTARTAAPLTHRSALQLGVFRHSTRRNATGLHGARADGCTVHVGTVRRAPHRLLKRPSSNVCTGEGCACCGCARGRRRGGRTDGGRLRL